MKWSFELPGAACVLASVLVSGIPSAAPAVLCEEQNGFILPCTKPNGVWTVSKVATWESIIWITQGITDLAFGVSAHFLIPIQGWILIWTTNEYPLRSMSPICIALHGNRPVPYSHYPGEIQLKLPQEESLLAFLLKQVFLLLTLEL